MIETLEQIVYDRGFVFTEILKNEPIKRPEGNISLAILLQPSFKRDCKLYIIKNDHSYFLLGQLKVKLSGEEQIQQARKVIAYHKDPNRKPTADILDVNDPSFNIEWHFSINESFYNTIFETLSKIHIPIKASESGLDGTNREIYINHACPIHIVWWESQEHHWNKLTDFTDGLLSFSLTKFNKAYLRK
jgi:hypothetical protein